MKTKRAFFTVFLSLILALLMTCPTTFAVVQTEAVAIKGVKQKLSKWCWAACAEIVGTVMYPSTLRGQKDVVKYLKGTDEDPYPNVSGRPEDSKAGSMYITRQTVKFGYTYSTWNFSQIAGSIAKGHPVQAGAGYYVNNKRDGGHMVVIYMTQFVDTASGISYYIDYYDPWDGLTYHCTLSSFCDGSFNGRKYDQTVYVVG